MKIGHIFIFFFLLIFGFQLIGQTKNEPKKIELVNAENAFYNGEKGQHTLLIGNVIFQHENMTLYCDSAYLYTEANSIDAFSNIHIKANDSVNIFGDSLKYNGNTKIAEIHKNVKLLDNQITLTTEHLIYDIKAKTARYYSGGKIVDPENTLTSKFGFYYSDNKNFFFNDSVVLVNNNYTIHSDSLKYNTATEISTFYGPTEVFTKDNYIYTEKGWYNTKNDDAEFSKNSLLKSKTQTMTGDSIYYRNSIGLGLAYRNVQITDSARKMLIRGDFVRYDHRNQYSLATINAELVQIDDRNDSLFLHADTIIGTFDTITEKGKMMLAYHHVKFFRNDLQGMCDSLIYNLMDSTITMHYQPVLWSEDKQLSADTIVMMLSNSLLHRLYLKQASFMASNDDSIHSRFNQIRGVNMIGFFEKGILYKIRVQKNAETIYYMREDNGMKNGINKAIATNMDVGVKDEKIVSITFIDKPIATLFPETSFPKNEMFLKDFIWLEKFRPKTKKEIFITY